MVWNGSDELEERESKTQGGTDRRSRNKEAGRTGTDRNGKWGVGRRDRAEVTRTCQGNKYSEALEEF